MLFAAIDYYQYKNRKGKYSHEVLTNFGLRKACESEFPNWKDVKLGGILFVHTANSRLSWLVMYFENIPISHVAMLDDGGTVHELTTQGYARHSLNNYFNGASYLKITNVKLRRSEAETRAWIEKKFRRHLQLANRIFNWF